jgi:Tfp pilus assembly protein PilV
VEVLATLLFLGIVLPATMGAISVCLQAASSARHRQEASLLAEAHLNELLVLRDSSQIASSGNFGPEWPEYAWEATTRQSDFNLTEVSLTVTWIERGRPRSLTLTTLLYPDDLLTPGSTGTIGLGT